MNFISNNVKASNINLIIKFPFKSELKEFVDQLSC